MGRNWIEWDRNDWDYIGVAFASLGLVWVFDRLNGFACGIKCGIGKLITGVTSNLELRLDRIHKWD